MSKLSPAIILIVLSLVVVAAIVGFSLGKNNPSLSNSATSNTPSAPQDNLKVSPLLETQTATAYGKIIASDGKTITLEDKDGKKDTFTLLTGVSIAKYAARSNVASVSGETSAIDLNEEVMVVFNVENGEYRVSSISYLPPVNPVSSPEATSPGRSR